MWEKLFSDVDIKQENVHIPDGLNPDWKKTCAEYERSIRSAGGIDLQILGLGPNGHIGFNEPGSPFDSRTRLVELSEATIRANASDFPDGNPATHAITMGMGTILEAEAILLLVTGDGKAEVLQQALEGPIDEKMPASALRTHRNVIVLADKAAARHLSRKTRKGIV
ncbi:glucosamine-6-phosphate deaminase [Patescibacteria group bacterium]|nr:glucosamine-6-phosphate deaminase [Patescibacteria group bacterium]